jgi:hypothetical protein
MAFDVNRYKKSSNLSPTGRIISGVVKNVMTNRRDSAIPIIQHAVEEFLASGASKDNVSGLAANRANYAIAMNSSVNADVAGDTTLRATPASITSSRQNTSESIDFYLSEINPTTKIRRKKADQNTTIHVIV